MARKANLPAPYLRGDLWYGYWASGRNRPVRVPLKGLDGRTLRKGAHEKELHAALARQFAQWFDAASGTDGTKDQQASITFAQLAIAFIEERVPAWRVGTCEKYLKYLKDLERIIGNDTCVDTIDFQLARYVRDELAACIGPGAVNCALDFVESMFRWGQDARQCRFNPFAALSRIPRNSNSADQKPCFSDDEAKRILAVARERFAWFYPVVALLAIAGPRTESVMLANAGDFKETNLCLELPNEISKWDLGKKLHLPEYTGALVAQCARGRESHEPLFLAPRGGRLYENIFRATPELTRKGNQQHESVSPWLKMLRLASVDPRPPKFFRKAVDSNLVGERLKEACQVTGHTTEVARRHYLQVLPDTQRSLMHRLERLYGLVD